MFRSRYFVAARSRFNDKSGRLYDDINGTRTRFQYLTRGKKYIQTVSYERFWEPRDNAVYVHVYR